MPSPSPASPVPQPGQPLHYAPPPPLYRRRRFRQGVTVVVLMVAGAAAWRWGPRAWARGCLQYYQRQCLEYAADPNEVVYEAEPVAAATLLASGRGYVPVASATALTAGTSGSAAARPADYWHRFLALADPAGGGPAGSAATPAATVFLHGRRTPSGRPLLVHVGLRLDHSGIALFIPGYDAATDTYDPGTWSRSPAAVPMAYGVSVLSGPPRVPADARVYAGQPDPADPSRFTIRYRLWGQEDMVDGFVDDHGWVSLKARHRPEAPPATRPATAAGAVLQ